MVNEDRGAVGGPAERDIVGFEAGRGAGVAGLGRVDGDPAVRPRRHDRFSVGRNGVKKKTDPLRGDRAGLAAGDVFDEEPGTVARLVARDENPAPIREPGRRLAVESDRRN